MSKKNKTLMILGIGQTNFLNPIYKAIKENTNGLDIYIQKVRDINNSGSLLYNDISNLKNGLLKRLLIFFKIFNAIYFRLLYINLFESGLKSTLNLFKKIIFINLSFSKYKTCDYYHFHFVVKNNLLEIPLINEMKSKIIISFWGSDLMRKSGLINFYLSSLACKKASIITIQSIELKEILLSKYSRDLHEKIKVQQFILDKTIFDSIDRNSKSSQSEFLDSDKINILIGHNANPDNRHKNIVDSLLKLKNQERYTLVFVFGYGINNEDFKCYYKQHLKGLLEGSSFNFRFIDKYLDPESIGVIRRNAEITIHTPVSDALSAAITESMYAGNMVITGAWLPYGPFRRAGCKFWEVEAFDDLISIVQNYEEIVKEEKSKLVANKLVVKDHFLSNNIAKKWIELFQD